MKKLVLQMLVAVLLFACSDDVSMNRLHPQTITLKFEDTNEMLEYFSSVVAGRANAGGRTTSRLEEDFLSFRDVFEAAVEELSGAQTVEAHDSLLALYQDVLTLVDSTYVPKIENPFYQHICNRFGIYESGGYAHKVLDKYTMVITDDDNIATLQDVRSIAGLDLNKFRVAYYAGSESSIDEIGRIQADCGDSFLKDYFHNRKKCSDDRRVYVRGLTSYIISGYQYTPYAISEAWGELRNWLCNWKLYDTVVSTKNCSFTISVTINGIVQAYPMTFPDKTVSSGGLIIFQGNVTQPITWQGGSVPSIQFTRIHEEATSRGVGDNWVIMDCQ